MYICTDAKADILRLDAGCTGRIGSKLTELEQWNKLKLVKEIAETV